MAEVESDSLTGPLAALADIADRLQTGWVLRLDRMRSSSADWHSAFASLDAQGLSIRRLSMVALVAIGIVLLARLLIARGGVARSSGASVLLRDLVLLLVVMLCAGAAGLVVPTELERRVALAFLICTTLGLLARHLISFALIGSESQPRNPVARFVALLSTASIVAFLGLALRASLQAAGMGRGLLDALNLFLLVIPVTALVVAAYVTQRREIADALSGDAPVGSTRHTLSRIWPWIAIAILLLTVVAGQLAVTLDAPLKGLPVLVVLLLVLIGPHLDRRLADWSRTSGHSGAAVATLALRKTARLSFAIAIAGAIFALWLAPALAALEIDRSLAARRFLEIVAVAIACAYLWNVVEVATRKVLDVQVAGHEGNAPTSPPSRLGTLLPIISGTAKAGIMALAALTILVALGVNVWPLVTGLSVFGLAIGFGSQSLVKDVVSGIFFLLDDAFRVGEYIETSGAKGTVDRLSVRSLSLRHPRGAIATIPYGQIGKVLNFSRDWVIEKLAFRVAFDTDVELVRKLFKKVGQEIADDPDLNGDLLEPFKSQGIAAVDDGTLIIRGKFKARAGQQFMIRKAVLSRVQRAFAENGIVASPRPFSMPAPR